MEFEKLTIKKIKKETSDTVTVFFDVKASIKEKFSFKAGQYLTVKELIRGEEVRRSYSISSAPFEDELGITIKKIPNGKLSTIIHNYWKVGDEIEVSNPDGHFMIHTDHTKKRNLIFIAAGSGITPVLSMLKTILEEEPMSTCFLLYGSRNENEIIFHEEIKKLEEKFEGQLLVSHTISKPSQVSQKGLLGMFKKSTTTWKGETGRINENKIINFLDQNVSLLKKDDAFYICGPGDMISLAEEILHKRNVEKSKIHREYFSTKVNEEDAVSGKSATVKVILNKEEITFKTDGKKHILDELIALKKNPPYSCTSGACSSCMAKVTKGKLGMDMCFALEDEEIESGLVLTCQAKPLTEEVELTFDI